MAVIAYADYVTVFFTSPEDVRKLQETLLNYEAVTGEIVNMRKSRALALRAWDMTTQIMDIPYHTDVKILGFHFTNKVNTFANVTWSCSRYIVQRPEPRQKDTFRT